MIVLFTWMQLEFFELILLIAIITYMLYDYYKKKKMRTVFFYVVISYREASPCHSLHTEDTIAMSATDKRGNTCIPKIS